MKVTFCKNRYCPWLNNVGNGYATRYEGVSTCKKTHEKIKDMNKCPLPDNMDKIDIANDYRDYIDKAGVYAR